MAQEIRPTWIKRGNITNYEQFGQAVALHGGVGCVSSVAGGGKCGPGALSASFSKAMTPVTGPMAKSCPECGIAISAVMGGTASVLGGGKFANGTMTASFGYLFNAVLSSGTLDGRDNPIRKIWERVFGPDKVSSAVDIQAGMSVGGTAVHVFGVAGDIGPVRGTDGTCAIMMNQCFIAGPMIAYTFDTTLINVSAGSPGPGWSLSLLDKASVPVFGGGLCRLVLVVMGPQGNWATQKDQLLVGLESIVVKVS